MHEELRKREQIAQWGADTGAILDRFHLELVDVDRLGGKVEAVERVRPISFMDARTERMMTVTMAVTALGTHLFGGFGEGEGKDKETLNRVKKHADGVSAYTMSEALWFASRHLPENHAIMVFFGEGLMPKGGESAEMGSNPQLGFGRVYARNRVADWLEQRAVRLINDPDFGFDLFYREVKNAHISIWGAAIDTLENTTRFAKGRATGPMTVLHLFDQPMNIAMPYEGYIGTLTVPKAVVTTAENRSILLDFRTPRGLVMEIIKETYPDIRPENVHVWVLQGESRAKRIGALWQAWRDAGARLVDEEYRLPSGLKAFADSGTYAPTYRVGTWNDASGARHLFLCDGYAATAESIQAATLADILGLDASMVLFSSKFNLPYLQEQELMRLDPGAAGFEAALTELIKEDIPLEPKTVRGFREMIEAADSAGFPTSKRILRSADFFPEKRWNAAALTGYIRNDPYSGTAGIEEVAPDTFRVTTRIVSSAADAAVAVTLRLTRAPEESHQAYTPLLMRFLDGEEFRHRTVRSFDSGRIRNELQTLCSEALEFKDHTIRVHFERILSSVIPLEKQRVLEEVLRWYKQTHPIWFSWLELDG